MLTKDEARRIDDAEVFFFSGRQSLAARWNFECGPELIAHQIVPTRTAPVQSWGRFLSEKSTAALAKAGRAAAWVKVKNPKVPAVQREAEEDWGR